MTERKEGTITCHPYVTANILASPDEQQTKAWAETLRNGRPNDGVAIADLRSWRRESPQGLSAVVRRQCRGKFSPGRTAPPAIELRSAEHAVRNAGARSEFAWRVAPAGQIGAQASWLAFRRRHDLGWLAAGWRGERAGSVDVNAALATLLVTALIMTAVSWSRASSRAPPPQSRPMSRSRRMKMELLSGGASSSDPGVLELALHFTMNDLHLPFARFGSHPA